MNCICTNGRESFSIYIYLYIYWYLYINMNTYSSIHIQFASAYYGEKIIFISSNGIEQILAFIFVFILTLLIWIFSIISNIMKNIQVFFSASIIQECITIIDYYLITKERSFISLSYPTIRYLWTLQNKKNYSWKSETWTKKYVWLSLNWNLSSGRVVCVNSENIKITWYF